MNKPIKTCRAYLPPSFSEICGKEVDQICKEQCFKHCYNQDYPDNHYLRCKNPKHPPYQESKFIKQFKQSQAVERQLKLAQNSLVHLLNAEEINEICQVKAEITELELKLEQNQAQLAQIIQPTYGIPSSSKN